MIKRLRRSTPKTDLPRQPDADPGMHARPPLLHGRTRRPFVIACVAAAFVAVGGFAVLLDHAVSLPALCGRCHEIEKEVRAWSESAHAEVGCYSCHADPAPVYLSPSAFVDRTQTLSRDVYAHVTGRYEKPVRAVANAIPDSACGRCHQPGRTATRDGLWIDHAAHAKRKVACVSCHRRTAHPGVLRERGQAMMADCFRCHGLSRQAEAPGRCGSCHPEDFDLVPSTHKRRTWLRGGHGRSAKSDETVCRMCHVAGFCRDCHGLDLPHSSSDAEWRGAGHIRLGTEDRSVCERCHEGAADMCSTCHHKASGYRGAKGPWVTQHFVAVRARGAAECFDCHSYGYCSYCHVRGVKSPSGP